MCLLQSRAASALSPCGMAFIVWDTAMLVMYVSLFVVEFILTVIAHSLVVRYCMCHLLVVIMLECGRIFRKPALRVFGVSVLLLLVCFVHSCM